MVLVDRWSSQSQSEIWWVFLRSCKNFRLFKVTSISKYLEKHMILSKNKRVKMCDNKNTRLVTVYDTTSVKSGQKNQCVGWRQNKTCYFGVYNSSHLFRVYFCLAVVLTPCSFSNQRYALYMHIYIYISLIHFSSSEVYVHKYSIKKRWPLFCLPSFPCFYSLDWIN